MGLRWIGLYNSDKGTNINMATIRNKLDTSRASGKESILIEDMWYVFQIISMWCDKCHGKSTMWEIKCDVWNVTNAIWKMQYKKCNVKNKLWHMKYDKCIESKAIR